MLILKASALQMRMDRGIYHKCFANSNKKNPYIPRETYGIFHYRYTIIA